jgi:hypothetical protein
VDGGGKVIWPQDAKPYCAKADEAGAADASKAGGAKAEG